MPTSACTLTVNGSMTVRIRAQIKPSSTATSITNQAHLSAQSPTDPISTNDDSLVVTTTLSRQADLAVTKTGPASAIVFFFNDTATTEIYTLSLHDALPIFTDSLSSELQNATFC